MSLNPVVAPTIHLVKCQHLKDEPIGCIRPSAGSANQNQHQYARSHTMTVDPPSSRQISAKIGWEFHC